MGAAPEAGRMITERDGRLALLPGEGAITGVAPRVAYRRPGGPTSVFLPHQLSPGSPADPDAPGWHASNDHLLVRLVATDPGGSRPGVVLTASVTNQGPDPLELLEVSPLHVAAPHGALQVGRRPSAWSVYRNGWNSWSVVRRFRAGERDKDPWFFQARQTITDPDTPRRGQRGVLRSELVTAIADTKASQAVVLGFVGGQRSLGVIDLHTAGDRFVRLHACCRFDGITFAPGETVQSEPLLVAGGRDGVALLEQWADELGERERARVPERPPGGWCSWYYYFASITEDAVRENLAQMDRLSDRMPVDYVMVDDGHQRAVGDWLRTNHKFPSGMRSVADAIRATGRDAGIWIAPFIVDPRSEVAREHPDWLLRTDDGAEVRSLWNPVWARTRQMRTLDCTRPDVQEWLAHTARTIRHDWGYRVLKLDFCYAAALPGRRHDPRSTRAMALRAGLDAIRAGAGDDAFLLGCGLPLGPAVGAVDGMRIGPDVSPFWNYPPVRWASGDSTATEVAVRSTLTRSFMHGRLWANDPDCLMVRADRTRLTLDEIRTLAAAVGLTDGMPVASDRISTVPDDRMDLLATTASLLGGECRVVDLLDRAYPETVVSRHADATYVGVLNMAHRPRRKRLDLASVGVPPGPAVEVFTGRTLVPQGASLDLGTLPPHSVQVLRFAH